MKDELQRIENANMRKNASGVVCARGKESIKEELLSGVIPRKLASLHKKCAIHIHDLEFYDSTYNCIGVSVLDMVEDTSIGFSRMLRSLYRRIIDLTNRQSGGIGFINFDEDVAQFVEQETDKEMVHEFREWFCDLNTPSRKGCEAPYVTLNIGLCKSEKAKRVVNAILDAFIAGNECGDPFVFPNIVFKLKKGVNVEADDYNRDLLEKAFEVTAKRMIPTYFNADASFNNAFDEHSIGVMGCRTRVAANCNGTRGSLNRGNIASLTINLPQLAYKAKGSKELFYSNLDSVLESAKELLLHRYKSILERVDLGWLAASKYYIGHEKYSLNYDNSEMMKNGTLAIGFIGLWDAIGIMNAGIRGIEDIEEHYVEGYEIIKHIRAYTDRLTEETGLNFSVLATAAEGTTGRFARYDEKHYGKGHKECQKGYYTNSFHVPVELKIPYFKKCEIEGPFHALCNGGAITYMEFNEMPYRNVLAVEMAVKEAYKDDCGYIGINFPMDVCKCCGHVGRITDSCPRCSSKNIKRFRRVSGYLAEELSFADGKKAEMKHRKPHFESEFTA